MCSQVRLIGLQSHYPFSVCHFLLSATVRYRKQIPYGTRGTNRICFTCQYILLKLSMSECVDCAITHPAILFNVPFTTNQLFDKNVFHSKNVCVLSIALEEMNDSFQSKQCAVHVDLRKIWSSPNIPSSSNGIMHLSHQFNWARDLCRRLYFFSSFFLLLAKAPPSLTYTPSHTYIHI